MDKIEKLQNILLKENNNKILNFFVKNDILFSKEKKAYSEFKDFENYCEINFIINKKHYFLYLSKENNYKLKINDLELKHSFRKWYINKDIKRKNILKRIKKQIIRTIYFEDIAGENI